MPPSWVGPPHDASSKTAAVTIVVKSRFMLQTPQDAHGCSLWGRSSVLKVIHAGTQTDMHGRRVGLTLVRPGLVLGQPGVHSLEECLALAVEKLFELRQCARQHTVVQGCTLETRRDVGSSHQVVSVRGRNVSDHRTPQTNQLRIHRLWDVDTLQCLQASIRCFPYRPGCAQLLEKSRCPHITRSAEAQQCGECGAVTLQREQRGHPVGIQKPRVLVPGGEHQRCLGNVAGPRLRRCIEPLALLAHFPACQAGQHGRAGHIGGAPSLAELLSGYFHICRLGEFGKVLPRDTATHEHVDQRLEPLACGCENLRGGGGGHSRITISHERSLYSRTAQKTPDSHKGCPGKRAVVTLLVEPFSRSYLACRCGRHSRTRSCPTADRSLLRCVRPPA